MSDPTSDGPGDPGPAAADGDARSESGRAGILAVFASFALTALAVYLLVIGQSILLPLVLAVFIVILLNSMAARLTSFAVAGVHAPRWAGMLVAVLIVIGGFVVLGDIVASNVAAVTDRAPGYEENVRRLITRGTEMLGVDKLPSIQSLAGEIDIANILRTAISQLTSVAGNVFTIVFYVAFILLEQATFKAKIRALFRRGDDADTAQRTLSRIAREIQRYIGLKTAVSLMTGVLSYAVMAVVGVDFAGFWAVLIFVLNYIPYVGSLVGVAFPSMLALIQFDTAAPFIVVTATLAGVQLLVGNVVEPRLMGRSLNLSPLVILLSLAVFGSIWGIVGMVLSIPFMVIAMIICAQFPATRPVAVLLSAGGRID